MIKDLINRNVRRFGYEINSLAHIREKKDGFDQWKFVNPDGTFDYDQYRRIQVDQSKAGLEIVWVKKENIDCVGEYLKRQPGKLEFGLCHGSKRGNEQLWLHNQLGCKVIGTDISDSALQFPNTIQWDFHEVKPEWIGAVDFIYSNALDHSYDPQKCINAWMSCIRPGGCAMIEWNNYGEGVSLSDPFSSPIIQLVYAITKWGNGAYCVRELIPTPANPKYLSIIVIYKF